MKVALQPIDQGNYITNRVASTVLQITAGAFFLGLSAHIKIPLFFTPIPLSLQTLAALLLGASLGKNKGFFAVLLYLGWGCLGLPVFASGVATPMHLLGPSGGYIVGFLGLAYLTGLFIEKNPAATLLKTTIVLMGMCLLQLGLGTAWLSLYLGWDYAFTAGFVPFLPGEILKVIAATSIIELKR